MKKASHPCYPQPIHPIGLLLRFIVAWALAGWLMRQRRKGNYARRLFGFWSWASACYPSPRILLLREAFRRDLGYRSPRKITSWIENGLEPSARGNFAMLATLQIENNTRRTSNLCPPSQARCLRQRKAWVAMFYEHLAQAREKGIAVVGNAAHLADSPSAAGIDGAGFVIRFNRWQAPGNPAGTRCDAWVRSAEIHGPPPAQTSFHLLSGPAMLSRLCDQTLLEELQTIPVLDFPLPVWRALVRQLAAPPTAGLCTLLYMRRLLGAWDGIIAYGFGNFGGPYHIAGVKHRPSSRHNWLGEQAILAQWKAQGLVLR